MNIKDDFKNLTTTTFLRNSNLNKTDINIMLHIFKEYNAKYPNQSFEKAFQEIENIENPIEKWKKMKELLLNDVEASEEKMFAYALKTFIKEQELLIIATSIHCRIKPFDYKDEWYDNFRLNSYGYQFSTFRYAEYDNEDTYTLNMITPKNPEDVKLTNPKKCLYTLANIYRVFVYYMSLNETSFFDYYKNITDEKALEILDALYKIYPFYYGGSHGCNCFLIDMTCSYNDLYEFSHRYPNSVIGYILNTESYGKGGKHWIALIINNDNSYLLCSQGSDYSSFDNKIVGIEMFKYKNHIMNTIIIQTDNNNCGLYASLMLYSFLLEYQKNKNVSVVKVVKNVGRSAENIINGLNINKIKEHIGGFTHP